jgi:hypothetical protein
MAKRSMGAVTLAAALAGPPALSAGGASYDLRVRVSPERGALDARAEIACAPCPGAFTLARDLAVRRVLVDGRAVAFVEAAPAGEATTREVTIAGPTGGRRLAVEYRGALRVSSYPPVVSLVNHVRSERVELAGYAAWYPRPQGLGALTFRLAVDLPPGFVAVTNGRLVRSEASHGRALTEWESFAPSGDIVLVAARHLRVRKALAVDGVSVEVWSSALPDEYVAGMAGAIARAVGVVEGIVGAPLPSRLVRVVYAPRPGWGYARQPLIVVSEEGALAQGDQPSGRARDLRYVVHEMAHGWWNRADTSTPEDWLNEGLAEYTAWLAAESESGPEFASRLLGEYRQRSADSPDAVAILETASDSPDREVNRYARPVLFLEEARQRLGHERMGAFLNGLYRRFAAEGRATTAAFLDEAGSRLGPEAAAGFSEALRRRSRGPEAPAASLRAPTDAAILGTWTGELTQAGITTRVVLHLVDKEGGLAATLDSPDQGAAGIAVPTVSVSGGELTFGLGSYGIRFRGALARDGTVIAGEWVQSGATSRLTLTRAETPAVP